MRPVAALGMYGRAAGRGESAVSAETDRRPKGRTRRAREPLRREVIQKVKLTDEERDQLRARAAELGMSVPRLLVESALSGVETPTERRRTSSAGHLATFEDELSDRRQAPLIVEQPAPPSGRE